ncbi:N-acetylmuramoyl-L-alanine amidase [Sulfuriroseicoccus oceanibius]|uniref:N-acetylmuramoyl-L-alanine amidase n=1 Tax=Sulfuriroseicoccus oceanibius TaxID=2707525 RepID=A0A6B3LF37_9BACT|nr:N-acetylmuramoyl-L-alanine amidase [Sulfuriroseicoccus oceanibius]QQL45464.1 N-acetylmuramoyl-L-alanine amidase [Sulfuriroseicoccus oceanibius]
MIPRYLQLLFLALLWLALDISHAQRSPRDLPDEQSRHLAALGHPPDWKEMEAYHGTITADRFRQQLEDIYVEKGKSWEPWIVIGEENGQPVARIRTSAGDPEAPEKVLRLARTGMVNPPPRYWTPAALQPRTRYPNRPLTGVHIALDPGHIGGAYARLEGRWFVIGSAPPVMEGEMALRVAYVLRDRLEALGAEVTLVRARNVPVTRVRPVHLRELAKQNFINQGVRNPPRSKVSALANHWFCVSAEIRARAELVNRIIKPDLVVCLHFNAEAWGNPARPSLHDGNHLHILTTGCLSPEELAMDDQRLEMLHKLIQGSADEEIALSSAVARRFVAANPMRAFEYNKGNARRVNSNPYVWARNLLASRLYQCPVVYMEPYVMNTRETFKRVQAGAYSGKRKIHGKLRPNIFVEYADAVANGIADHYRVERGSLRRR